jgi:hypothetical protein
MVKRKKAVLLGHPPRVGAQIRGGGRETIKGGGRVRVKRESQSLGPSNLEFKTKLDSMTCVWTLSPPKTDSEFACFMPIVNKTGCTCQ